MATPRRELKRTLTCAEIDDQSRGSGERGGASSSANQGSLRLPLPLPFAPKQNMMDPPLEPPPRKRPVFSLRVPDVPQSPPRTLTPRVSWSEIVSHSQESLDMPAPGSPHSPRTPNVLRLRQSPSPPTRACLRRRPLSEEEFMLGHCQNEGRFAQDFSDVLAIGKGQFSTVYRAKNNTDQCVYAIKKTTQISRGGLRQQQLREVFALASLAIEAAACPNIVRYFSSWVEDERLHIQTEFCECSLRDRLSKRRRVSFDEPPNLRFGEAEIVDVLRQVTNGLLVLHGHNYVHLDIKPDNILVSRGCYKIADLGLATLAIGTGCDDISEGDCRYLAKEVLRGDLSDLTKADVFSLGMVLYELGTNPKALPCNGDEWHQLRDGRVDVSAVLHQLSEPICKLTGRMMNFQAGERPTCEEIAMHPQVAPQDDLQALQEKMRAQALEAEKKMRAQALEAEKKMRAQALEAEKKMRAQAQEAERNRKLADEYWHEMLLMKRQELLNVNGGAQASVTGNGAGARAVATPQASGSNPQLRRGMTY